MYKYSELDKRLVIERAGQFRRQLTQYLSGQLTDEEFLPLRLQNGLYIQRFAPMLRIAVPYGMLSSTQLRKLASLVRTYDKGYCHFTTRQNIQLNWTDLEDIPEILQELTSVEMHAIQTSGNCIRNTTSDHLAGITKDEIVDPRPYCELVRQWSTLHPEFAFLPRKFKIAINGSMNDRASIQVHDIGLQLVKSESGEIGFRVYVGGGLGRTPVIASLINEFLPEQYLLSYLCAILRVYNRYGRRDNKYKARIKILLRSMGVDEFSKQVESEWGYCKTDYNTLDDAQIDWAKSFFSEPKYKNIDALTIDNQLAAQAEENKNFYRWFDNNTFPHKIPGYISVTLSLKATGAAPGDVTDRQLESIASIADEYSFGEVRSTHQQNLVLADVEKSQLFKLWKTLNEVGFATPNIGLATDMVVCPGGDFCALANAKSIPIATAIQDSLDNYDYLHDLGPISLNISGCMNACAHHHTANIGVLGVDKKGEEYYQVTLGGNEKVKSIQGEKALLGKVLGPAFMRADMPSVINKILTVFIEKRFDGENFFETCIRIGLEPFKKKVYS